MLASMSTNILLAIGMKCMLLVNLSTMNEIESTPRVVRDNFVIKSMAISSHLHIGMGDGYIFSLGL